MKIEEIREMTDAELDKRIVEEENNLVELNFQNELKNLTNTAKLKDARRDVARMKTILKERSMEKTSEEKK